MDQSADSNLVPKTEVVQNEIQGQKSHWDHVFSLNQSMYGTEPSAPVIYAIEKFNTMGVVNVLELGSGQGRDTIALLRSGFRTTAVDFAHEGLEELITSAGDNFANRLTPLIHDVRSSFNLADASFDACYSHMLFTMALTTIELERLVAEIHRLLRSNGLCIYTVRHVGDSHFGQGTALGDNIFENGGFVVHFFDNELVSRLANGFTIDEIVDFEEGSLPRKLWRVTMRRNP